MASITSMASTPRRIRPKALTSRTPRRKVSPKPYDFVLTGRRLHPVGSAITLPPPEPIREFVERPASACSSRSSRSPFPVQQTPLNKHASEAHIHRIRNALTKPDFKVKVATSLLSLSDPPPEKTKQLRKIIPEEKHYTSLAEGTEEDDDDVESLDWAAPFKHDFIISSSKKKDKSRLESKKSEAKSDESNVPEKTSKASACNSDETLANTEKLPEENRKITKRRSPSNLSLLLLDKEIPNYSSFIKTVQDEIKVMATETKRLDIYSIVASKGKESRKDIVERGYETLKRIYELNKALTEAAAKRHICGSPGANWMGLTRVDVLNVMKRIRKESGDPQKSYIRYTPIHRNTSKDFVYREKKSSKRNKKGRPKKDPNKRPKPSGPRPLRHRIQHEVQHVPGPKHLHTNICIRPWEPTWDGWSQADEDELTLNPEFQQVDPSSENKPVVSTPSLLELLNIAPKKTDEDLKEKEDEFYRLYKANAHQRNSDDYITLEIFNPIYRGSRPQSPLTYSSQPINL